MENFYLTFGQSHTHAFNGITLDKDIVGVIKAESYSDARLLALDWFGREWSHMYESDDLGHDFFQFFPRGTVELN